jgi:uncharacterized protein (TIGR02996 family)
VSEQDALLEAVFKSPRDDTPRLVYADWLDEHGEGLYAEFIRTQIARQEIATKTPERDKLLKQEDAVWKKLKRRWADPFEGWKAEKGAFTRGFHTGTVEGEAHLGDDDFEKRSPQWWPWLPIRRVYLFTTGQFAETLLDSDYLRRLTRLRLFTIGHEQSPTEEFIVQLFSSTRFERLVDLEINPMALSRVAADTMRTAPFLDNLRRFNSRYYSLGHMGGFLLPTHAACCREELPRVRRGRVAALLREELDSLAEDCLIIPPGETNWRPMLEATQQARGG